MGLFSRWKERKREQFRTASAPYREARDEIWNREIARGQEEFTPRIIASQLSWSTASSGTLVTDCAKGPYLS